MTLPLARVPPITTFTKALLQMITFSMVNGYAPLPLSGVSLFAIAIVISKNRCQNVLSRQGYGFIDESLSK